MYDIIIFSYYFFLLVYIPSNPALNFVEFKLNNAR